MTRQDYQWRHEPVIYGWKEGSVHYFAGGRSQDNIFLEDDIDFSAMKKEELVSYIEDIRERLSKDTTILFEKKPVKSRLHPTMKPVALFGRHITNSSKHKDIVADFFGGSGTTLIACEQLNRSAYVMELSEKYCDIIIDRWEEYTGKKAVRLKEGELWQRQQDNL